MSTRIDTTCAPVQDAPLVIDIEQISNEAERFKGSSKNVTLFRVMNDNKKSLERRIIPLLEMFKVETGFFRQLQHCCLEVVKEKK